MGGIRLEDDSGRPPRSGAALSSAYDRGLESRLGFGGPIVGVCGQGHVPFPYYDPVLLLIYKIGLLLALFALLVSLAQLGHRTRMLASAAGLSLVMLAVWVFQASLE